MSELTRVSETIKDSKRPATYYRAFVKAAQSREFQGVIMLADTLKLPPAKKGGKAREVSDYAVLQSPDFEKWHAGEVARESVKGVTGIIAPRFADLVAGQVDAQQAAQDTLKALDQRAERNAKNAARVKKVRKGATSTDD